jgi:saccharopine dehydrogenase-like NADP-dependent oxidoreductase
MGPQAVQHTIALFGAGKIGEAITALLSASGRYAVKVCDADMSNPTKLAKSWANVSAHQLNLNDKNNLRDVLKGCSLVISALPFACNVTVAQAAAENNVHYADLTEDVRVAQSIASLATNSSSCFMPQCGLAPGFISIAAAHLATLFDSVESLKMRVGALPVYPTNRLKYNLTWSTDGLVNEYLNPCEVIRNGEIQFVPPLEGYERLGIDGVEYEAFNTSGGLGSLCKTLKGKVKELTYKTIRYPGHRDLFAFLLEDLKFSDDRETLKKILERSVPNTPQDKCIIYVEATGSSAGKFMQKSYVSTVYHKTVAGHHLGAIQVTTASGVCGVIDLLLSGELGTRRGLVTPEEIPLKAFLANEFGKHYLDPRAAEGL